MLVLQIFSHPFENYMGSGINILMHEELMSHPILSLLLYCIYSAYVAEVSAYKPHWIIQAKLISETSLHLTIKALLPTPCPQKWWNNDYPRKGTYKKKPVL